MTSKSRLDRFIGELSYPVYVVHILVINILGDFMVRGSLFTVLAASITVFVSIALVKYVQAPTEKYRMLRLKTGNTMYEAFPTEEMQGQKVRVA